MMSERIKGKTINQSGAAGNMCEKTARKYLKSGLLPSQTKKPRTYRTREDIFADVWPKVTELLESNQGLEAKTIFEYLQKEHPGRFQDSQLRTLQRKMKQWKVIEGPEKEIYFPQEYKPGIQCQSDFTSMNSLMITINHIKFEHMLYHFVMPYSNWETGSICYSESFEALSDGLQNALWELGGVPKEHRTDRLSAAINNLSDKAEFTERYKNLLKHYNLSASKTNPYSGNENGDAEQAHHRFKKAVDQALMLRGSRNFNSLDEYKDFLKQIFSQKNSNRYHRLNEELPQLKTLPSAKIDSFKKISARVTKSSDIRVSHCVYSVPSRLIGEKVDVFIYADRLRVFYAQKEIQEMPRLRGESRYNIQYRHVIGSLIRKPGAFENYKYKSYMYPSTYFKMAYDILKSENPSKYVKLYLEILYLAGYENEEKVEQILKRMIDRSEEICPARIKTLLNDEQSSYFIHSEIDISSNLDIYDSLLRGKL